MKSKFLLKHFFSSPAIGTSGRFRCVALFCVLFFMGQGFAQQKNAPDLSLLHKTIHSWVDSGYYGGASLMVVHNGKTIVKKYYGNHEPGTVVFIASAGKWLAVAAIAAVVEEGGLHWNDKVRQWIPEMTDTKGDATLLELLSHTAGYPDYQPVGNPVDIYQSLKTSVAHIIPLPADTHPGAVFKYGGLSIQVAGRMAELATGKDWETIFQQKIAIPLGMKDTHFTPVDSAGGHAPMLGGGARTTLEDYMNFLEMFSSNGMFNGKTVLKNSSIKMITSNQVKTAFLPPNELVEKARGNMHKAVYGLGVWREELDENGNATLISSPSWAGAYPWIDVKNNVYGFFLTHIVHSRNGFNSFLASPVIPVLVREALKNGMK